jgi:pimeloyl-ACP methyl ester carboxylesterase
MHIPLPSRFQSGKTTTTAIFKTSSNRRLSQRVRKFITALIVFLGLLPFLYGGVLAYIATQVEFSPPLPITQTPAAFGLRYHDVTFYSRIDHVRLRGWFIPGVLPDGRLSAQHALIMVHGTGSNRAAPLVLKLGSALARRGFAILAFDMRGMGESAHAPLSEGYFEQRDVLGAVDFLRSGSLPYPELERPYAIGGWGISMGAVAMLLAAAQEPAILGVVADCAFAAFVPLMENDTKIPNVFIPGVAQAMRLLYGTNYYAIRPVDVVASIAPRPLFFIHSSLDTVVPPQNMSLLAAAASAAPDAHVQTWLVPGADHVQAYHVMGTAYVKRVEAFFTAALSPSTHTS